MAEIDPTENALATIASILDDHGPARQAEKAPADGKVSGEDTKAAAETDGAHEVHLPADEPIQAEGYSRLGPGPFPALRYKWTVHRGNDGRFYVHETIGESLAPIVIGPFTAADAVRAVDQHEAEARQRFEALRNEIAGQSGWAEPTRGGYQA